jgi:hypothetical protein
VKPSLADEARHLHACLFQLPLDPIVISRYEAAHRQLFADEAQSVVVATVVARRLDAEAVEFALRRRGAGRQLTRKLQVICYLVEVRSAYYSQFVNTGSSRLRAVASLLAATLSCAWKRLKGEYLVRRHGLV